MIENAFLIPSLRALRGWLFNPAPRARLRSGRKPSFLALALVAGWLAASAHAESSVTLAWDPSPDASVVGYRVYAQAEDATATSINVLGLTQVTLPGLKEGFRYTFTVSAYNAAGLTSAPSDAVGFVVPVPLNLLPGTNQTAPKRLQFPMAPGHWYEVQSSTNMKAWTTVWQTNTAKAYLWTEVQEPASGGTTSDAGRKATQPPCRFFRLQVH